MSSQGNVPLVINSMDEELPVASKECDCACPSPSSPTGLKGIAQERLPAIQAQLDSSAYFKPVNQDYQIAFSSSMPLTPVILNTAACRLAQMFESPRRIAEVVKIYAHVDIIPIIAKLVSSRLLRRVPSASVDPCNDKPTALVAWLHMSNNCNLNCTYCYLEKTAEMMLPEIGHAAVEAVFRTAIANDFGKVKIKYAGGEPTLNFPLIMQLHKQACMLAERHGIGLDEVILSNGINWTQEMITAVQECSLRVMISLDGIGVTHDIQRAPTSGNGSCASVIHTIDSLLEGDIIPHISVTITDQNAEGLPELVGWLLKQGLPFGLNFYRGNEHSTAIKDLSLNEARIVAAMRSAFKVIEANLPRHSLLGCLLDRASLTTPHRYPCGVGRNYLVIEHNGYVAKCQMKITHPVATIHDADVLQSVRTDQMDIQNPPVDEKEGCRDCQWRYWCAGGCPLVTYQATGRYDTKSPNCNIYQALFPEVLRLEGLRLLAQGMNGTWAD